MGLNVFCLTQIGGLTSRWQRQSLRTENLKQMKHFFIFLPVIFFGWKLQAQHIFSSHELDYTRPFAPYEIQNVIALDHQETVMLLEEGKGKFRLARYDNYFFDKWRAIIDYNQEGSFPKLIHFPDAGQVGVFRYWTWKDYGYADVIVYDIATGQKVDLVEKTLFENYRRARQTAIRFSEDFSRFVLYAYPESEEQNVEFYLYDLKTLELQKVWYITGDKVAGKSMAVYINGEASLCLALADSNTGEVELYYFAEEGVSPIGLSAKIIPPQESIADWQLKILKQSETSFLVFAAAYQDEELKKVSVTSFNVVLKSVLYSNTLEVDRELIKDFYAEALFTSQNQGRKNTMTPQSLKDFLLQQLVSDGEGGVTAIFERQQQASIFHAPSQAMNLSLKWGELQDANYAADDLLLLNFSASGVKQWAKAIHKTQQSHQHGLGLSYVAEVFDDELKIAMQESSKGHSIYTFTIDLHNGGVVDFHHFFEKKIHINKNYSRWLDKKTLLVCAYPPGSMKRKLYLVEFR